MSESATSFIASLADAVAAASALAIVADQSRALSDDALMSAGRAIAHAKAQFDAAASVIAGEVVKRSTPDRGLGGLARRTGFRTPQALIQDLTGGTSREASTLVKVGAMLNDTLAAENAAGSGSADSGSPGADSPEAGSDSWSPREPRLVTVGAAVAAGELTVASAEALRAGLGSPGPGITGDDLAGAARDVLETLSALAASAAASDASGTGNARGRQSVHADHIYRLAREARDQLDEAGIRERELARRAQRSFTKWRKPDGMTRYTWELDPEGAALVDGIYDQLTSPRRGGPRFLSDTERARAEAIEHDPRTVPQLASDGFLQLLQLAVDTDPIEVIGIFRPGVRVLVTATTLEKARAVAKQGQQPTGHGRLEGRDEPVSIETVQRYLCTSGHIGMIFNHTGEPLSLGREKRTFTRHQRRILAARDGGCRWPECDRPPSWAEAHHIEHWQHGGTTNIDNGILLCRHHHLLLHDHHWAIDKRGDGSYWLVPPTHVDPTREPRPMPSKSHALTDLARTG